VAAYFDPLFEDDLRDLELGFKVDFNSMSAVFDGGFAAPIVEMIDRFDQETDDPQEAYAIIIAVPPDRMETMVYMEDLMANAVFRSKFH
jgi:hypothetical protein